MRLSTEELELLKHFAEMDNHGKTLLIKRAREIAQVYKHANRNTQPQLERILGYG